MSFNGEASLLKVSLFCGCLERNEILALNDCAFNRANMARYVQLIFHSFDIHQRFVHQWLTMEAFWKLCMPNRCCM